MYTVKNFPFDKICKLGEEMDKVAYVAGTVKVEADKLANNIRGMRTVAQMAAIVSSFVSSSREPNSTDGNRETMRKAFSDSINTADWSKFEGTDGFSY